MSTRILNFSRGDAMLSVARRTAGLICSQAYWKMASRRPCLSVKCLMSCDWLVPASLQMAAVVAASKPRSAMRSLADSRRRSLLEEITEVFQLCTWRPHRPETIQFRQLDTTATILSSDSYPYNAANIPRSRAAATNSNTNSNLTRRFISFAMI